MSNLKIESIRLNKVVQIKQEFVLENMIPFPKHTLGMLSSLGGMGKSFICLQLAALHINTTGESVGCWFTEDEAPFVKDRYTQLVEQNMIKPIDMEKLHLITNPPPQLARTEKGTFIANYDALCEIRCWCVDHNIKLLFLDPLIAFYGGEENNNGQARVFMQPFIEFCKQDGVTIILIHHARKPANGGEAESRGAGAFKDAVRCAYELHSPMKLENKKESVDVQKLEMGIRSVRNTKDNRGVRRLLKKNGWENFMTEMKVLPSMHPAYTETFINEDKPVDFCHVCL